MTWSSSARRFLAACLAVLAVSGAIFGFWLWRVDRRKTAALKESFGALATSVRTRERYRPILHGRPEEGNAWADYRRAFQETSKIENRAEKLVQLQLLQVADPDHLRETFLDRHGAVVDHLRRGATRKTSRDEGARDRDPTSDVLLGEAAFLTATLAEIEAHALWTQGNSTEAIEVLLDLCQFARDCIDSESWMTEKTGLRILELAFDEARRLLASGRLDKSAAKVGAEGLSILDDSFPPREWILRFELSRSGEYLLKTYDDGNLFYRLNWASDFEKTCQLVERAATAERLPWMEARAEIAVILEEARRAPSWQSRVRNLVPEFVSEAKEHDRRLARAQVRLLRAAMEYRRTGELPNLEDPLGSTLLHSESERHIKIWSGEANRPTDPSPSQQPPRQEAIVEIPK